MGAHVVRTYFVAAISVVLSLMFGQLPEFAQQYAQRLGGAIDELNRIVGNFDQDARRSGYDRDGALALMRKNQEQLVRDQATRLSDTINRLARLRTQQTAMKQGDLFTRVGAFAVGYDQELAARTWSDFSFGLPLSADAILFTGLSFILSLLVLGIVAIGLGRLLRPQRVGHAT